MFKPRLLLILFPLILFSCGKDSNDYSEPADGYTFKKDLVGIALTKAQEEYVGSVNDFAFKLLHQKANETSSFVLSPLGAAYLVGLLSEGAGGQTREEMLSALGFEGVNDQELRNFFLSLKVVSERSNHVDFSIDNASFLREDAQLLDSFVKVAREYYDAISVNLDFSKETRSLSYINGWAESKTKGLITKALDSINPGSYAYFLNVLYFNGKWERVFPGKRTGSAPFHKIRGGESNVTMMKDVREAYCSQMEGLKTVRLDYIGGDYSFYVILPDKPDAILDEIYQLSIEKWEDILSSLEKREVDLWIPKFETESQVDLMGMLQKEGVNQSFSGIADFTGMSASQIFISRMNQRVRILVNEEGTEAASVSVAEIGESANVINPGPFVFHADHPFAYFITENKTGAILLQGVYL